jgi:carboxypeptidase Q
MESDTGAFFIYGLSVTGPASALAQLQALAPLLAPIGSGLGVELGGDDTDEAVLCNAGVPCAALWPYDPRVSNATNNPCLPFSANLSPPTMPFHVSDGYMLYHHTEADTVDKLDPAQLQVVAASNAIWAASVANLPGLLPRA